MSRVVAFAGLVLAASITASALAQQNQPPKSDGQLRGECYREMGYTREQAQQARGSTVLMVNDCVAKKKAGR